MRRTVTLAVCVWRAADDAIGENNLGGVRGNETHDWRASQTNSYFGRVIERTGELSAFDLGLLHVSSEFTSLVHSVNCHRNPPIHRNLPTGICPGLHCHVNAGRQAVSSQVRSVVCLL